MTLLESISGPRDLKALSPDELPALASEIRDLLIEAVSRTGGHLGPNLGVVELTIALHRVFDSPQRPDRVRHRPPGVRAQDADRPAATSTRCGSSGGLSGYPSRAESEHDVVENSPRLHRPVLRRRPGQGVRAARRDGPHVVAVVGDGALTGGMSWEALNNIAARQDRPLVIVVNDNGRSYAPTIGGLADHLADAAARTAATSRCWSGQGPRCARTPLVGQPLYETLHGDQEGHQGRPRAAGHVRGPRPEVRRPGRRPRRSRGGVRAAPGPRFGGPVIVHCVTRKGCGYPPAEDDEADRLHGVGVIDPTPGCRSPPAAHLDRGLRRRDGRASAHERADIVAITAAMLHPVGLAPFAEAFPDRVFDVGIAEQHAVDLGGRAWPWAGCTRWSRSTRRSSTGPSTRC